MINKQTGLMVFIKGFPPTLNPDELRSFLQRTIAHAKRERSCENGSVRSCRIVRTTNTEIQKVECYALVEIKPVRFALFSIKVLHGNELAGETIVVRRYRQRSLLWERRRCGQKLRETRERRILDRRREGLRIEDVEFTTPKIWATLIRAFRSQPPVGAYAE